jgi:hypothetical protein
MKTDVQGRNTATQQVTDAFAHTSCTISASILDAPGLTRATALRTQDKALEGRQVANGAHSQTHLLWHAETHAAARGAPVEDGAL